MWPRVALLPCSATGAAAVGDPDRSGAIERARPAWQAGNDQATRRLLLPLATDGVG